MKKGFAFILLLCHMNFSMFLPQLAETDTYDVNGKQEDDINSVIEYVDQVILGHKDATPEDEDDDNGQNFSLAKTIGYFYEQTFLVLDQNYTSIIPQKFSDYIANTPPSVWLDITVPPPKA